jgi:hypothetical protein
VVYIPLPSSFPLGWTALPWRSILPFPWHLPTAIAVMSWHLLRIQDQWLGIQGVFRI